jgi:hypothetical protein
MNAIGWCNRLRLRWEFWGIIYSTMEGNIADIDINLADSFQKHCKYVFLSKHHLNQANRHTIEAGIPPLVEKQLNY